MTGGTKTDDDVAGRIMNVLRQDGVGYDGAADIMQYMLSGRCDDDTGALILDTLADRNVGEAELLGMLDVIQRHMIPVEPYRGAIDMCGTGGDGLSTFNVSTAASFVAAAAGVPVAKHGNRSSSGGTGSADIFELLGHDIENSDPVPILDRHGICFMFARRYHPAARHAAGARKIVGRRTVFNMLGPLCNPAGVKRQLVGVSDPAMLRMIPRILSERGSRRVMSVMSQNGIDEISAASPSRMILYADGHTTEEIIEPASLGIRKCQDSDMRVGGATDSLGAFVGAISGNANHAIVQTAALNAAAGLVVAGMCDTIHDGYQVASHMISSGRAQRLLVEFVQDVGDIGTLEGLL